MAPMRPDADPPPPPEKPLPTDCCDGGCAVCVWETYDEALRHYRQALAAWEARADSLARGSAASDPAG